jgi:hypothetical protein
VGRRIDPVFPSENGSVMNLKEIEAIKKEHMMLDYLEDLLKNDRKRLHRVISYIKDRIYEEEAAVIAKQAIERVKNG